MADCPTLAQRCRSVDMLIVDVDGVLTAGGIVYGDTGFELKSFHVRDGSGLKLWQLAGKQAAVITGRQSPVVKRRADELGISLVYEGREDKLTAFREVLTECGLGAQQACYMGDDIPDLPVLRHCGLPVAVADACAGAIAEAQYVTRARGGAGAVREVVELILRCQGHWHAPMDRYRNQTLDRAWGSR